MFYPVIRKGLFRLEPERAHHLTFQLLRQINGTPLARLLQQRVAARPVTCMGLTFPNPVGLAAGLDKDGECIDALGALGFGFIETGTVTPRPQPGNASPRLFRLVQAEGLINRMGFNNQGVDQLVENVRHARYFGIIGINIGKNRDTPVEKGKDDYLYCMDKVYDCAGYIAVNISSPNTPGLRTLQYGDALDDLLSAIKTRQQQLSERHQKYVPVAVKIAPDLSDEELTQIAATLLRHRIDGVIATNTTLDRQAVAGQPHASESGGLSGKPLRQRSTAVIRQLAQVLEGRLPIIGVGGIDSLSAAQEKLQAGATLVQLYTGFIYQGPGLIKTIVNGLTEADLSEKTHQKAAQGG